ncbi:MAG: TauD/TfdA family dioxygenase [Chloroflexota bacterium]
MKFQTRQLSENFGVEVLDVDLTQTDSVMAEAILSAVQQYALLLFRRQSLHDDDLYRLSAALGPVEEPPAARDNCSPRFKSVVYLANINSLDGNMIKRNFIENTDGAWHSDQAYRQNPATLSTLFCVIAPEVGGGTSFSSTRMGYESLPTTLKDRVETMKARYSPGSSHGVPNIEVSHPAVLANPQSGVKTLYVAPNTRGFVGLKRSEGEVLKDELLAYQLHPDHIYQHAWRMGDMLIYDNAQLLHKRDAFEGVRFLKATRLFLSPARFAVPD